MAALTLPGPAPRLPLPDRGAAMPERVRSFVEARDTFFLATASPDGAPYVQHRGGPVGFLQAVDEGTLAFADYAGNRQYLSHGNLAANDRVMLLLIDFATRRRLKVWGRARVLTEVPAALAATVHRSAGRPIERLVVIDVDRWDWNCPQHITPRFTAAEWEASR